MMDSLKRLLKPHTRNCVNCRYWANFDEDQGYCWRYPPSLEDRWNHDKRNIGECPITSSDWMCGEYRVRQAGELYVI